MEKSKLQKADIMFFNTYVHTLKKKTKPWKKKQTKAWKNMSKCSQCLSMQ